MTADPTLAELLQVYPGASLTLFSRFGIGSRDKLGFRPEQRLREVLSRYLVFDTDKVLRTIQEAHAQQERWTVPASPDLLERYHVVDCRSAGEFAMTRLPGARFLDAALASQLMLEKPQTLFYCHTGGMAGAAAQHFAGRGLTVRFLQGGLEGWRQNVDPTLPTYGPTAQDSRVSLRILSVTRRARLMLAECVPPGELWEWVGEAPAPGIRAWRQRDYLVFEHADTPDWGELSPRLLGWRPQGDWNPRSLGDLTPGVERVLRETVGPALRSHKGEVELVEIVDDVASLRLSGGCQGCSSAAITVSQEIAAQVMDAVPEILAVRDATDHSQPGTEQAPF